MDFKICIVGAGFSGICMAIKLKEILNISSVIFDENEDLGGTWLVNKYPGCACDIPSHLYSYSFEHNPEWSEAYSSQQEIWQYLKKTAYKHKIHKYLRTSTLVKSTIWVEQMRKWKVTVQNKKTDCCEDLFFDIVINGAGVLRTPLIPPVFQDSRFRGQILHAAQWDTSVDLTGKSVAVVGTGASAVQIIPAIADKVSELHVFQRSPSWTISRWNFKYPNFVQLIFSCIPVLLYIYRLFSFLFHELALQGLTVTENILTRIAIFDHTRSLHGSVADPRMRQRLMPSYSIGCKRVLKSDDYFSVFSQKHVQLHEGEICDIDDKAVHCGDRKIEVDVIILATGFKVQEFFAPMEVIGRDNFNVLEQWVSHRPENVLGIAAARLPNYFFLLGPGTILSHNTVVFMIECQVSYIIQILAEMRRGSHSVVEVSEAAQSRYQASLRKDLEDSVWSNGKCSSWYLDKKGQVTTIWPHTCLYYWYMTYKPNFKDFLFS